MFIVAVAAIGGLLDRLVLDRAQPLAAPRAAQATAAAEVSGASALYLQELSGVASSAQVRVEGAEWRTGDMVLVGRAGAAAFTGVQAVSFNTGVASVVQSAVSVAAHAVRLAPAP